MKFELAVRGEQPDEKTTPVEFWLEKQSDGSVDLWVHNKAISGGARVLRITKSGTVSLHRYNSCGDEKTFFKYEYGMASNGNYGYHVVVEKG
jgi:hypothetical protein